MKNRIILTTLATLSLSLAGCKIETEHTVTARDERGGNEENRNNADSDVAEEDRVAITSVAQIAEAVENDQTYFANADKLDNWLWSGLNANGSGDCGDTTMVNQAFTDPNYQFAVGCQFTNPQCNEIGWYEQVHDDFLLIEITVKGEHVDPQNCLGVGKFLCEISMDEDQEGFAYNCEATTDEPTAHEE